MIRYAITNRKLLAGESGVAEKLMAQAARWAAARLDYIQLREKDLPAGLMELAARAMVQAVLAAGGKAQVLVNGRLDVAIAAGAAGVHLTGQAGELTVAQVRQMWPAGVVSVACHSVEEVARAGESGADIALFGPVFEKPLEGEADLPGVGLERLRGACQVAGGMKVLALGGVSEANEVDCLAVGAAGVAGIRLYLDR